MSFRRALVCCCTFLSLTVWADVTLRPGDKPKESTKDFKKDKEKNGYLSPEPRDRTFTYITGLSVDVELEVATSYLGPVKFTIKDEPQHGKLSAIRPHPSGASNKALITYTNTDTDQLVDRFTFQGKVSESSTSAPGTISLFGKKSSPRLEVLENATFKRLQPGQQEAGRVVLLNSGTAPFSGQVSWPAPFIGPPSIDLAVNEKQTIMISIRPPAPGAYRLEKELQPGVSTSRVISYVECIQPFVVTPGAISLAFDPSKGNRAASVKIVNGSDSPLKLRAECPSRLLVEKEVTVPAKATHEFPVAVDASDVTDFRGELWIIQEPVREKVVVYAEAEPPQIRLASPVDGKFDFGKVEKGKKGQTMISIANDGGQPAVLKFLQAPPFLLTKGEASIVVPPGKSEAVALNFAPEQPGSYSATLGISGNGGRVDVALRGILYDPKRPGAGANAESIENPHGPVRPKSTPAATERESATKPTAQTKAAPAPLPASYSKPPPAPASLPTTSAPATVAQDSASSSGDEKRAYASFGQMSPQAVDLLGRLATYGVGPEVTPQFRSTILERVPAIGVKEAGNDHVVLVWQTPKVEPRDYLVQESYFVRNEATGMPLKTWKTVETWKPVTMPAGAAGARIEGLKPETRYEWRVLGIDNEGKLSLPSDLLQVEMPASYRIPAWLWLLLCGGIAALGGMMYRRMREQRSLSI